MQRAAAALELAKPGASRHEGRGALPLGLLGLSRGKGAEALHAGIADVFQQVAVLVGEPPEHVVEDLPSSGIRCGRRLACQIQEFPRDLHTTGRPCGVEERCLSGVGALAPAHLGGRHSLAQKRARGRLPALEGRLDLGRLH